MIDNVWGEHSESALEARRDGTDKYYTGKACKWGHFAPRSRRFGICSACLRRSAWKHFYGYRMPPWADTAAIDSIYQWAAWLSAATGRKYEVDHIVPLNGEKVSGLHVPANLQILTREDNHDKGNSWDGA